MASGGNTSFTLAVDTEQGDAEQLNQIIAAWIGTADRGVPLEMVEVEHSTKYALDVRNKETGSSLVARFRNAAGEVLLQLVKEAVTIGKPCTFTGAIVGNITGDVTGDLTGDVTGNVTGNVTGDVTGDLTGDVTGNADTATTATGIADGAVSTAAKLAAGVVTAAKVAADVATQAELDAHTTATTGIHGAVGAQTANKLVIRDSSGRARFADPSNAQDAATKAYVDAVGGAGEGVTGGDSHDHSGGDGAVIPAGGLGTGAVTAPKIGSGAVTTPKLAANSVDDTKAGNRVPQFYRRQGGSATVWETAGSTTYTPGAVRMVGGAITWSGSSATYGSFTITLPLTFAYRPLFLISVASATGGSGIIVKGYASSESQASVFWNEADESTGHTQISFNWLAVGPE